VDLNRNLRGDDVLWISSPYVIDGLPTWWVAFHHGAPFYHGDDGELIMVSIEWLHESMVVIVSMVTWLWSMVIDLWWSITW
jgi:hypothetical protein